MEIFNVANKPIETQQRVEVDLANSKFDQNTVKVNMERETIQTNRTQTIQNKEDKEKIKQKLDQAVKKLNKQMEELNINIKFGFNDKIDMMYVDVIERDTGKLIRKIPSEAAMKLTESMREFIGIIFDKKG